MQLFFKTLLLKIDPLFGGAFDGHGGRGWGMDVTRLEPLAELVSDSALLNASQKAKAVNKLITTAADSVRYSP